MVFSSLTFLFLFLPLVIILYFLRKETVYRNIILLVFSIFFYAWGEPIFVFVMLISIINDYVHALLIDRFRKNDQHNKAKLLLISSIVINLGLLGVFKYADFIVINLNAILGLQMPLPQLELPIGISFYTFQTMSYTIDVYWGKVKAQRDFLALTTYVSMFPQLIAGPIVRYETIERELLGRTITWDHAAYGIRRFIIGLAKKVLIANQMAIMADVLINLPSSERGLLLAWIGILAYALQIYFDFSGYSDMAIGLGKIFGFNFLENFNYPYISKSITEFWRRWHISLSTWFRDYVYIPLGGNRVSSFVWLRNVAILWALTGLWHGASWNFVLWGVYYGCLLVIEKFVLQKWLNNLPQVIQRLYAIIMILYGWVLFRIESLVEIKEYTKSLLGFYGLGSIGDLYSLNLLYLFPFLLIALICATPLPFSMVRQQLSNRFVKPAGDLVLVAFLFAAVLFLVNNSFNPFIYYRF